MNERRIADSEVQILAGISSTLRADYDEEDLHWEGSPFAWIKTRPSRQRGAIGELLVSGWCAAKNLNVARSPDSECDRLIEGKRTEIKFSTLWKSGVYKFQQVRDQNYEMVICLGVSPFDAHCWALPKAEVLRAWRAREPGIGSQHGGRRGRDTGWINVNPREIPAWLSGWGGTLRAGYEVLRRLAGKVR